MDPILVVVDPALGISQGHHAGFAEMVADSCPAQIQARYVSHRSLDQGMTERLQRSGIAVSKVFSQDFYSHYHESAFTEALNRYILTLAKEYIAVFRQLTATAKPHLLLYHTLNWEHANALSLALQTTVGQQSDLQHSVLLMFNPGINHRGETTDARLRLNFQRALKKLQPMSQVKIYASCSEYAHAYAQLLDSNAGIEVHPNLFGMHTPDEQKSERLGNDLTRSRILLYLGDAKADKGFQRLPQQIRRLQKLCGTDAHIIIQYCRTPDWERSGLLNTEQELEALVKTDARLELHIGFWSHTELNTQLQTAALMILDYEPDIYAEKTSGLLWLAAHYSLPIIAPKHTWATREAKRLGLAVTDWAAGDTLELLQRRLQLSTQKAPDQRYKQKISQPFWDWIETTTKVIKRVSDAS